MPVTRNSTKKPATSDSKNGCSACVPRPSAAAASSNSGAPPDCDHSAGHDSAANSATTTRAANPAARSPRRSESLSSAPTVATGASGRGVQVPKRGATMRSVTNQPAGTTKNVMPTMKYQLPVTVIFQSGTSSRAAASVMPSSRASNWPGSRLAEYPPATPANEAAIPTMGWRPAAANSAPDNGIITTKAASEAWFAMTDTRITIGVSSALGARPTPARIAAPASPVRSAMPAPSMTSST